MKRAAPRPPRTGPRSEAAVLVRLTDDEKTRLSEKAKRAGLYLGPWLRMLGMNAPDPKP